MEHDHDYLHEHHIAHLHNPQDTHTAEDFRKNGCILPERCRHRPLRIARLTFHMWELLHAAPFLCALTIAQQARIVYNARKDIYYSIKRRNA